LQVSHASVEQFSFALLRPLAPFAFSVRFKAPEELQPMVRSLRLRCLAYDGNESRREMWFKLTVAACIWLAMTGAASAQVYKWVDEHGKIHYGDRPPDEERASKLAAPKSVSTPSGEAPPAQATGTEQPVPVQAPPVQATAPKRREMERPRRSKQSDE
jgi:hypothetical protein